MEENKVAQKLRDVLEVVWRPMRGSRDQYMEDLADAILQSPDLRVTLVERPKWRIEKRDNLRCPFLVFDGYYEYARATFGTRDEAQDWLNSKEPK